MEKINIFLEDGIQKEVNNIFYLYNSKYYFIYTKKEIDENGYVILYLCQIGKELKNTPAGPVDTGNMIGVDIDNPEEWHKVQESISKIVNDKKNGANSPEIQYLSNDILKNLKIVSNKKFRLVKQIMEQYFDVSFEEKTDKLESEVQVPTPTLEVPQQVEQPTESKLDIPQQVEQSTPTLEVPQNQEPVVEKTPEISTTIDEKSLSDVDAPSISEESQNTELEVPMPGDNTNIPDLPSDKTVIIDYRAKLFEEQEKNKKLEEELASLKATLEEIKKILG